MDLDDLIAASDPITPRRAARIDVHDHVTWFVADHPGLGYSHDAGNHCQDTHRENAPRQNHLD
jgi:hypothetical protein